MIALIRAAGRASGPTPPKRTARSPTKSSWAKRSPRIAVTSSSRRSSGSSWNQASKRGVDSRPAHIKDVAEASAQAAQGRCIDLFYQHRVDPDVPIEDGQAR